MLHLHDKTTLYPKYKSLSVYAYILHADLPSFNLNHGLPSFNLNHGIGINSGANHLKFVFARLSHCACY